VLVADSERGHRRLVGVARQLYEMARTTGNREGSSMTPEPTSIPRKRKSKPTTAARNQRQKAKKKAAKERESASASGVVAITPEGPGRQRRVP
jgi:hypothetical protein